ncbi:MAG: hypothetical protein E7Z94_04080 [Actinomyces ruminicola]|nr:hypothetical protein [Actinomyces ruminicola]
MQGLRGRATRRRRDQAPAQDDPTPGQVEDFTMFLAWVAGTRSQADLSGGSGRAFSPPDGLVPQASPSPSRHR